MLQPRGTATAGSSASRPTSGGRATRKSSSFASASRAPQEAGLSEPLRKVAARTAESALSELDRLILAPVRAELDRLAPMALPVMITGSPGTGRSRAARYLHRAAGTSGTEPRHVFGARVDLDLCAEIARHGKGGRRGAAGETILIDAAEQIPADVQPHLARAVGEGMLGRRAARPGAGGLRSVRRPARAASLSSELWYALSALTVRMPGLDEREGQRLAIAQALDADARGEDGHRIRRSSTARRAKQSSRRPGRGTFGRCVPC